MIIECCWWKINTRFLQCVTRIKVTWSEFISRIMSYILWVKIPVRKIEFVNCQNWQHYKLRLHWRRSRPIPWQIKNDFYVIVWRCSYSYCTETPMPLGTVTIVSISDSVLVSMSIIVNAPLVYHHQRKYPRHSFTGNWSFGGIVEI